MQKLHLQQLNGKLYRIDEKDHKMRWKVTNEELLHTAYGFDPNIKASQVVTP